MSKKADMFYESLYLNRYFRGKLSDDTCEKLLNVINMTPAEVVLKYPFLEHCLFNCSAEEMQKIADTKQSLIPAKRGTLEPTQVKGVAYMILTEKCLNCDATGIGKTVQSAAVCNYLRKMKQKKGGTEPFRYLYLGEGSSVTELHSKMTYFTGLYADLLLDSTATKVNKYIENQQDGNLCSLVATHNIVNNAAFSYFARLHPFDIIIIDEAAKYTHKSSQIYKNTETMIQNYKYRVFLNATPISTSITDIYNLLYMVDPYCVPPATEFAQNFAATNRDHTVTHLLERNKDYWKEAVSFKMKGVIREDIAGSKYEDNHPNKFVVIPSALQRKFARKTSKYRMLWDFPVGTTFNIEATSENTPKVACTLDILKNHIPAGEKVYIYCYYKEAQTFLTDELKKAGYSVFTNVNMNKAETTALFHAFKTSDEYNVCVTNQSRALDLNDINYMIFYSNPTTASEATQTIGRMTREINVIGKSVYVIVTPDENEKLQAVINARQKIVKSTMNVGRNLYIDAVNLIDGDDGYYVRSY